MKRFKKYSIEEIENILKEIVLQNLSKNKKTKNKLLLDLDGNEIHALSDRYKLFFTKGYTCVNCGLTGSFFALEKFEKHERFHLNLYSIDENGKEILMTKDHIIPRSKGGKDNLSNYQTMCTNCNQMKDDKISN